MAVTIGVVGTGNMGSALVRGWTRAALPGVGLVVYDSIKERARRLADGESVSAADSLEALATAAEVVVVVVKPRDAQELLGMLSRLTRPGQSVVSSAAGIGLAGIRSALGPGPSLYRMMPNLGVQLGSGVIAVCPEQGLPAADVERMKGLLECLGVVEVVPEEMLNAVTAVSGSGIGFLAVALEGIEDGAVKAGLPRALARTFVRQTALATSQLLAADSRSAAELKDQVASPGGTTIAGLAVLEEQGVRGAFLRAVEAATERARVLQQEG
jgi:pyrroline-5-carboxylate reductase